MTFAVQLSPAVIVEFGADEQTTPYCQRCDLAENRSAELAHAFRQAAILIHVVLQHDGKTPQCRDRGCRKRWAVVEGDPRERR